MRSRLTILAILGPKVAKKRRTMNKRKVEMNTKGMGPVRFLYDVRVTKVTVCMCVCVWLCVNKGIEPLASRVERSHQISCSSYNIAKCSNQLFGLFSILNGYGRERSRYTHTCQRGDSRCLCRRRLQEDWNERERETVRSNQTMAIGWTKKIKWRRVVVVEKYWSRREK